MKPKTFFIIGLTLLVVAVGLSLIITGCNEFLVVLEVCETFIDNLLPYLISGLIYPFALTSLAVGIFLENKEKKNLFYRIVGLFLVGAALYKLGVFIWFLWSLFTWVFS